MKAKSLFLGLFLTINVIFAAGPTTYIVDAGGGGNFTTIGAALSYVSLANGDTIKVVAGTYSETGLSANKIVIMIAQDNVNLVSSSSTAITFNPAAQGSLFYNFNVSGGDIYVYGLTSGTGKRTVIAKNYLDKAIRISGSTIVVNNKIYHATGSTGGIILINHSSSQARTMIFNNDLRGCNLQVDYGFADIIANKVHAYPPGYTNDAGISITNSSNPHDLRIIANTVDSCLTGTGMYSFGGTNVVVANNILTNNANGLYASNSATIYTNNLIYNSSSKAVSNASGYFYGNILSTNSGNISGSSMTWDYNCIFNSGTLPAGNGNISSDPLMTDPANKNFVLQSGSPCIDTGHPANQYRDLDKTRMDMGIYGGGTSFSNFGGVNIPRMMDVLLTPMTVIQGNNITINASGIVE